MDEFTGQRVTNLEEGKRIVGLKSTAYKEYLAARYLLNGGFLHQAAFFINTCLEKEIKAYLFANNLNVTIAHDSFKLYKLLKNTRPNIAGQLNQDFFKMVSKIYLSRYYESLSPGYNFVIIKNKFLAELDFTFDILEPKTRFKLGRDKDMPKTSYELDKQNRVPSLYINNYLLNGISKENFLKSPDLVYEFRVAINHEIIEALYQIPFNQEPGRFMYEGLKPLNDNKSFQLSNHHKPENNTGNGA